MTFTAPQGTTTAIVGPSGSGKSTICNLVARFYDADRGSVSVGGHDVKEFTCESLLRNISMVFQNVYLFQDLSLIHIWHRFMEAQVQRNHPMVKSRKEATAWANF